MHTCTRARRPEDLCVIQVRPLAMCPRGAIARNGAPETVFATMWPKEASNMQRVSLARPQMPPPARAPLAPSSRSRARCAARAARRNRTRKDTPTPCPRRLLARRNSGPGAVCAASRPRRPATPPCSAPAPADPAARPWARSPLERARATARSHDPAYMLARATPRHKPLSNNRGQRNNCEWRCGNACICLAHTTDRKHGCVSVASSNQVVSGRRCGTCMFTQHSP